MKGLAIFLVILAIYFLPTITAAERKKRNVGAIFALNFFLGWTLIAWVISLVWALTVDNPVQPVAPVAQAANIIHNPAATTMAPKEHVNWTRMSILLGVMVVIIAIAVILFNRFA